MDSLYLEDGDLPIELKEEETPGEITYDENPMNNAFIPIIRPTSKIIQRNVRNSKRRGFR